MLWSPAWEDGQNLAPSAMLQGVLQRAHGGGQARQHGQPSSKKPSADVADSAQLVLDLL